MAFEISVNLEYMFHEAGERIEDRVAAAAAAGFRRVDMFSTAGRDMASLKKALDDCAVELTTVANDPRVRPVDPETHDAFADMFHGAAQDAAALNCRKVVVPTGIGLPYQKRPMQLDTVARAISKIVPIAEKFDITILLEPVNIRVDHPGVLLNRTCDAVEVINAVGSPRVRMLYDIYHSVTEGEDPLTIIPDAVDLIDYIQLSDSPGRGEPGSGSIDWPAILKVLGTVGYAGPLGVECHPTGASTPEALTYFRQLCLA